MFDAASAHRVVGAVSSGDAKLATVLYHIAGAWTSRVVATAADGHDELELLPALPGGAARPTGLVHLPLPLPYELPTHSLAWPLHPHAIWSELTTALRARDWAAARAVKRRVEEALRAKAAEMAEADNTFTSDTVTPAPKSTDGVPENLVAVPEMVTSTVRSRMPLFGVTNARVATAWDRRRMRIGRVLSGAVTPARACCSAMRAAANFGIVAFRAPRSQRFGALRNRPSRSARSPV